MRRREFLQLAGVYSLSALFPFGNAWAYGNGKNDAKSKKLIVILLRGAIDGLNVVAPYGDNLYSKLRPTIALPRPGSQNGALDLDGYFGLHPALSSLTPFWRNRTMAFVHASGSPDPTRSHFDAQDYMESGIPGSKSISSGWLNRLVSRLPAKESATQAISLGPILPRIYSGPAAVATISKAASGNGSIIDNPMVASAFQELYGDPDTDVGKVFAEGMAAHREIREAMNSDASTMEREQKIANRGAPTPRNFSQFGKQIAQLFRKSPSIQVAFLDLGGWDTHVNQGAGTGQLANYLGPLGTSLAELAEGLGPLYKDTTIIVMSEFGRTAKENGNGGTDHGHGNVMWLLGGDIPGGKVYGKWSGLSSEALYEGRDLPVNTDFRDIIANLLSDQMEIAKPSLAAIFPDFNIGRGPFV